MKPDQINKIAWERIIDAIKSLRAKGKTLEGIGQMCGVSKATVQRWLESGAGGEK